jgi:hypothetical protein
MTFLTLTETVGPQGRDQVLGPLAYRARFEACDSVGGLRTVLQLLQMVVPADVYSHLEDTFDSALMFLDIDKRGNMADRHDDIQPGTDGELHMHYLIRQIFQDVQGALVSNISFRNSIPITNADFEQDARYGNADIQKRYKFRADRLRLMLARAILHLASFGQSESWTPVQVQQHIGAFITEFNRIIAPTQGTPVVPLDATPDALALNKIKDWLPIWIDGATELPDILHNAIFKQFALLLTMFDRTSSVELPITYDHIMTVQGVTNNDDGNRTLQESIPVRLAIGNLLSHGYPHTWPTLTELLEFRDNARIEFSTFKD